MRSRLLVLVLLAFPNAAESQENPVLVRHRNDCRLAAQVLTLGEPANKRAWAIELIASCPLEAGPALAKLWEAPPTAEAELQTLFWRSYRVRDQRVYDAVEHVLRDTGHPALTRLTALGVLVSYVEPTVVLDLSALKPPTEYYPRWWSVWTYVDHPIGDEGAEPLAEDANARTVTLVRMLAESDPDPMIRDQAAAILRNPDFEALGG